MGAPWYRLQLLVPPTATQVSPADVGLRPKPQVADPKAYDERDEKNSRMFRQASETGPADFRGMSAADAMWVQGMKFYAEQAARDQDEMDAMMKGTPGYIPANRQPPTPVLSSSPSPHQMQLDMRAERSHMPGATFNAPQLQRYQDQVDTLNAIKSPTHPNGYQDILLPSNPMSSLEAMRTIAGQLEARRRALGGAVSIASPWNVIPETF